MMKHWSVVLGILFSGGLLLAGCQEAGPAEEAQETFEDLGKDTQEALEELEKDFD